MMQRPLAVENFSFNTPPSLDGQPPLKMAAKRYTDGLESREGVTLLLAHGLGAHKEYWEPMLRLLFQMQSTRSSSQKIREAWAFDWQTHGDSALLNVEALKARPNGVSISEWAQALVAFVNSKYAVHHRLIVIGHSAGASAWMYTTKFFPFRIPYLAIIQIEPELVDRETYHKSPDVQERQLALMSKVISSRKDSWSSKEDALAYFRKRVPWSSWNETALHIFVEYAICQESRKGDNTPTFVLRCKQVLEARMYQDLNASFDATDQIAKICSNVPIHIIFGELDDLTLRDLQDAISDRSKGRRVASVLRVPGAAYMLPQQSPDVLASSIANLFGDTIIHSNRL